MIIEGKDVTATVREEADVCIIGTGAGGAPPAALLAEAGLKVVVMEEGPYVPTEQFNRNSLDMTLKLYRDFGATLAIGKPGLAIPLGKSIGGSTTINSGTCFRIPDKILKRWKLENGLDITPEEMEPYFDQVEKEISVEPADVEVMGGSNLIIKRGAEKLGYHGHPLMRNIKGCIGQGICNFGCTTGAKQSTLVTYVPRASDAGAKIFADCKATKIMTRRGKVVGVKGRVTNPETGKYKRVTVKAKVVILAAGTIHSPVMLQANGLCKLSGQVGRNLRIHPATKVLALFDEEVKGWQGTLQAYCVDEFKDEGIIMEGFWVPPELMAIAIPFFGMEHKNVMAKYKHLAGFGIMVSDTSSGVVKKGVGGKPVIFYQLNEADTNTFLRGIAITAEIFFAAGAKEIYPPVHCIPVIRNEQEIKKLFQEPIKAEQLELLAFHPMGTCRMGTSKYNSVVDSIGETHEVRSLFVTDGSIFPTSLGVNPQETIMAFASRTADHILNNKGKYIS